MIVFGFDLVQGHLLGKNSNLSNSTLALQNQLGDICFLRQHHLVTGENISKYLLLKFLPSMLSVKVSAYV